MRVSLKIVIPYDTLVVKYLKLNGLNPSDNLHSKKKVGDLNEEE